MADEFHERARALLESRMLENPDAGVRAMTACFGVPEAAVDVIADKLRKEMSALTEMSDSEIDCSDIPENTDWSGAKRGMFTAQAIEAQRAETGTGSVHESAVGNADALKE